MFYKIEKLSFFFISVCIKLKGFFYTHQQHKTNRIRIMNSSCRSNFKMHCFVCDKTIERGDEITQVLESGGLELRKVPYTGSRWVHKYCLPKDVTTKYFISMVDDMVDDYPDTDYDDIMDIVASHSYWTREEDKLPVWAIPPVRPPTPPRPASNDDIDFDDSDDEYVESYFGPLKVDPVEKAEFEKTVDETLMMLQEKDVVVKEDSNKGINEVCDEIINTLDCFKNRISNEQKINIVCSLFTH